MPKPIPNIPPLSSIADPATRSVLQSIVDGWRTRNGEIGSGDDKFLTAEDLGTLANGYTASTAAGMPTAGTGANTNSGVAVLIQKIIDSVMQSRLWKQLGERIADIEQPEWFFSRVAGLRSEVTQIQTTTRSQYGKAEEAVASLNGNLAGVRQDFSAYVTATETSATAGTGIFANYKNGIANVDLRLTTIANDFTSQASLGVGLFARYNDNTGTVATRLKAVTDVIGTSAESVTTLTNTVGTASAKAEQALTLATTVEGSVTGSWSAKFDVNGYVTGFGLGVEQHGAAPPRSDFTVRADRFSIGSPTGPGVTPVVPFVVLTSPYVLNGQTIPPGVYIYNTMIANGTIDSAKIGIAQIVTAHIQDLAVDTLKIRGNAVSYVTNAANWSCPLTLHGPSSVFIVAKCYIQTSGASALNLYITVNGNKMLLDATGCHGGGSDKGYAVCCASVYPAAAGSSATISIELSGSPTGYNSPSINVMEVMR